MTTTCDREHRRMVDFSMRFLPFKQPSRSAPESNRRSRSMVSFFATHVAFDDLSRPIFSQTGISEGTKFVNCNDPFVSRIGPLNIKIWKSSEQEGLQPEASERKPYFLEKSLHRATSRPSVWNQLELIISSGSALLLRNGLGIVFSGGRLG